MNVLYRHHIVVLLMAGPFIWELPFNTSIFLNYLMGNCRGAWAKQVELKPSYLVLLLLLFCMYYYLQQVLLIYKQTASSVGLIPNQIIVSIKVIIWQNLFLWLMHKFSVEWHSAYVQPKCRILALDHFYLAKKKKKKIPPSQKKNQYNALCKQIWM